MESTRRNVLKALAAIGITGPLATDLAAQTRTLVSIENLRNAASLRGENFSEDRLRVIQGALPRGSFFEGQFRDMAIGENHRNIQPFA